MRSQIPVMNARSWSITTTPAPTNAAVSRTWSIMTSDSESPKEDTDPYRLLPFRSSTSQKVFDYCQILDDAKRRRPGDDVMPLLSGSEQLTDRELSTFFLLLVIAGNETAHHARNHGAHVFDLTRDPNRHVTFGGAGPHFCLGAWRARLEVRTFLEVLSQRVASLELSGDVERVRSNFINGLKKLPLTVTAG